MDPRLSGDDTPGGSVYQLPKKILSAPPQILADPVEDKVVFETSFTFVQE